MKRIYELIDEYKITPNALYALQRIVDKDIPVNHLINFHVENNLLRSAGLIEDFKLTPKGSELLNALLPKKLKKQKPVFTEWKDKIEEYNNLFPKLRKEGTKVGFRSNPKELLDKFVWFFEQYPEYDWDKVLEATKMYVESFEGDYTYMQLSKYFLKKEDKNRAVTSNLATMCYGIENDIVPDSTGFHYFGP